MTTPPPVVVNRTYGRTFARLVARFESSTGATTPPVITDKIYGRSVARLVAQFERIVDREDRSRRRSGTTTRPAVADKICGGSVARLVAGFERIVERDGPVDDTRRVAGSEESVERRRGRGDGVVDAAKFDGPGGRHRGPVEARGPEPAAQGRRYGPGRRRRPTMMAPKPLADHGYGRYAPPARIYVNGVVYVLCDQTGRRP